VSRRRPFVRQLPAAQTSFVFAGSDCPTLDNTIQVDIAPDGHRNSRCTVLPVAGGQHINKTSSAVRLIHKPTGVVVSCQTQRSQFQNRDYAMEMLKAKLYQIAKQQHMDKIDDIKGVQNEIAWGHQIRSYVFMPYTMVKDHRTNYETGNVDAVMTAIWTVSSLPTSRPPAAANCRTPDLPESAKIQKTVLSGKESTVFFLLLRQVRQDVRPQVLLLTQGVKAAVQIDLVGSRKDGAA